MPKRSGLKLPYYRQAGKTDFFLSRQASDKSTVTGYCLEAHDLAIAKYAAGRDKDYGFIAVMINKGILRKKELIMRANQTTGIQHTKVIQRIKRDFKEYASRTLDYNKMFGSPSKSVLPADQDQAKQAFLQKIKQRIQS